MTSPLPNPVPTPPAAAPVPVRVLVVDDQEPFRRTAVRVVRAAGFDVVAEAVDAASAVLAMARLRPDVVLLDVHLPDRSGTAITPELLTLAPGAMVLLLSTYRLDELPAGTGEVDGSSYLDKAELSPAELLRRWQQHQRRPPAANR